MANRTLFTLSVPVGTIRDFVFADDVAERIAHWAHAESGEPNGVQMKLFASGRSVTLGHVIAMTRAISRTPVRVLMASDAGQIKQPAALRFCTTRLLPLEHACPGRSLEEGIQTTWRSTLRGLQLGRV